jgi:hypothetical protein
MIVRAKHRVIMSQIQQFEGLLEKLVQIQSKLFLDLPSRQRWVAENMTNRRATLLIGPRGVGKTTYLLSQIKDKKNSLYVSLDNTIMSSINLFEFGDWLFSIGYEQLVFDEVHTTLNWSQHLKALYDNNPGKKIIASDSSALVLKKGIGDLSRRFVNKTLPFLSFREYLWLKYDIEMESITWNELNSVKFNEKQTSILQQFHKNKLIILKEFREYLNEGFRPFFLEGDYAEKSAQILDKIIFQDIPYFLPQLNERHIHLMKNVLSHLAESAIPRLMIDELANRWQVSKTTVYNLIEVMKETSLIRIIQHEGSIKTRSKGAKVFFSDPTHYKVLMGNLGNLREAYFCAETDRLKLKCFASDDETLGDFKVDRMMFEIGGKDKNPKGSDIVLRDNIESSNSPKIRPLWSLGFCERPL